LVVDTTHDHRFVPPSFRNVTHLTFDAGWLLLLYSTVGYWRVKRWETSLRSSQTQAVTPERVERDRAVRRQLTAAFGIPVMADDPNTRMRFDEHVGMLILPSQSALEEARLTRDLRAAGLM